MSELITSPYKVLFVCHSAARTGAPLVLLQLMRWLKVNTDWELETAIANDHDGELAKEFAALGPIHCLSSQQPQQSRLIRKLRHYFRNRRRVDDKGGLSRRLQNRTFDLVYSNTITNGFYLERLLGKSAVPVLTHVHELNYWIDQCGKKNMESVLRQTSHFIAASHAVRDNLIQRYQVPGDKVAVVHEFVAPLEPPTQESVGDVRRELGLLDSDFCIGGSGSDFWRKGHDLVPQLLGAVQRMLPLRRVVFLWIGREGNAIEAYQLKFELDVMKLSCQYICTGHVSNPLHYFAAMDVFAMLSRDDPFPLVCLEAGLSRMPIVCFKNSGGVPELLQDECGLVVDYLNVDQFASVIRSLAEDQARSKQLGESLRQRILDNFLPEHTCPALFEAMQRCVLHGGCRSENSMCKT